MLHGGTNHEETTTRPRHLGIKPHRHVVRYWLLDDDQRNEDNDLRPYDRAAGAGGCESAAAGGRKSSSGSGSAAGGKEYYDQHDC